MHFSINHDLLAQVSAALESRNQLYWVVGGSGSGKTTLCRVLSAQFALPLYDMDAHIYGTYHSRFTPERHPASHAWSTAENGLTWLLEKSWEEFNHFNQAALPEYLSLLAEDLATTAPGAPLLIDGGICNPAIIAQVLPTRQIVCLARPGRASTEIWHETAERRSMKDAFAQLPQPDEMWRRFLAFDEQITQTILRECRESQIPVIAREETESVAATADRVALAMGLQESV
jgi:ABC-type dipeptide/oligopeptide/nickel transport system ATPase component